MEVFNEDSPQKPTVSFDNICRTCNRTVLERNHPVDLFGKKMSSLLMQVVVFLSGKKISMEDNFPRKVCQPCFRKVISIAEFKSMTQASLSSQEQTLAAAKVKRLRSCQQVGDSPSSSQKSKKRVAARYVRTSLFSTDGTTDKTSSQLTKFIPIAPKPTTNTQRILPAFLHIDEAGKSEEKKEKATQVEPSVPENIMKQSGLRKYQVCMPDVFVS